TNFTGDVAVNDLSAEEDRLIQSILSEGVIKPYNGFNVAAGGPATMNVVVGSGSAKTDLAAVVGTTPGQGTYLVRLDDGTKTIALDAADPSLSRIDQIYLVVLDYLYDSSGFAVPVLAVRRGDAAASPSEPGPDAGWDAYVLLANVTIPAGAPNITAATIDN